MPRPTTRRATTAVRRAVTALGPGLPAAGCGGLQSALDPAGPRAERIAEVWWTMFWAGGGILLLVVLLALWSLVRRRPSPGFKAPPMIIGGGLLLPVLALTALLLYGYRIGALHEAPAATRLTVNVIGQRFWWRVQYPGTAVETAGELRIPAGEPVEVRLNTVDVIHSFWVPRLAGKLDLIPGRENRLWIEASEPGVFRGQCAEFCGAGHARMVLVVVAEPRARFDDWLAGQDAAAAQTVGPGLDAFQEAGCGGCHRIRGSAAAGRAGPDLTHVGGRWALTARLAPVPADTLAEWILASHWSLPADDRRGLERLNATELRTLADYLGSLR